MTGKAVIVAPRVPEFDRGSGGQRTAHFVEFLLEAGWSVTFVATGWHLRSTPRTAEIVERYGRPLRQRGVATYAGPGPETDRLLVESHFDLALLCYFHVAEAWIDTIRRLSPGTRVVVDSLDLNLVRFARQTFLQRRAVQQEGNAADLGLLDEEYASQMTREINTYSAADLVFTVSDKEASLVNDLTGDPTLAVTVPDGEDLRSSPVRYDGRRGVLFVGGFRHEPNVDAVRYLTTLVMPQLDPALTSEHPISIVGDSLNLVERTFGMSSSHVRRVGWVPSVIPYLAQSRVTVMPLPYGAGTKRKVIQALQVGTPAVATSAACEGLDLRDGEHILVANDPASFAESMVRLLTDSQLWHRLVHAGRQHMSEFRSMTVARRAFLQAVASAIERRPRRDGRSARVAAHRPGQVGVGLDLRLRSLARGIVPMDAIVLVVSRGDNNLLNLDGRTGWHFPRAESGLYAGHYPADSEAAIDHLEGLRTLGADYLILPATSFWWLDYYEGLRHHLTGRYRMVAHDEEGGMIFSLRDAPIEDRLEDQRDPLQADPLPNGNVQTPSDSERVGSAGLRPHASTLVKSMPEMAAATAHDVQVRDEGIEIEPPIPDLPAEHGAALDRVSARFRTGGILVLGTYRGSQARRAAGMARVFESTSVGSVTQQWIALGATATEESLARVTLSSMPENMGRFQALAALTDYRDVSPYEFVVLADSAAWLPGRFLDRFLTVQRYLDLRIAQPAHAERSASGLTISERQPGVLARQTHVVETGPVVAFHRSVYELVFPFDVTSPEGLGYECVWSYRLAERGWKMGIIDAVPIRVVTDAGASPYWRRDSVGRDLYLRRNRHYPLGSAMRTLAIFGFDEHLSWTGPG